MVVEAGARLVSITIMVPSVVSQFDFEFTSQVQSHVLVAVLNFTKSLLQLTAEKEIVPPDIPGSGSSVQLTES